MAKVIIEVSQRGSSRVKRSLKGIGTTSLKSSSAVNVLRRALAALGGVLLVREIVKSADAYGNLQNRLKLVTSGTVQLAAVTDRLFNIAQDTRNSFKATSEFYARTALAAKDLGKSQNELLKFTEITNKAIATSGVNSEAAAAGLIQLAQGISSDRLAGDELRSVLENIPAVADSIARGLKTNRGELRKLAAQGKLTGNTVINAILKDGKVVEGQFKALEITIGQASTKIDNAFIKILGGFKKSRGGLASLLSFVAKNLNTILKVALVLSAAILTKLVPSLLVSLVGALGVTSRSLLLFRIALKQAFGGNILRSIKAVKLAVLSLNSALLANPIVLLAAVIVAAITALTVFKDNIIVVEKEGLTLGDIFAGVWLLIKKGAKLAFDVIKLATVGFKIGLKKFVLDPVDALIKKFADLGDVFSSIFRFMLRIATAIINKILDGLDTLINAPIRAINALNKIAGIDLIKEVDVKGAIKGFSDNFFNGLLKVTTNVKDTILGTVNTATNIVLKGARARAAARNAPAGNAELDKKGKNKLAEAARLSFLKTTNAQLDTEIGLTSKLSDARKVEIELNKILNKAASKSIKLTGDDVKALRARLVTLQEQTKAMTALDSILKEINGPQDDFTSSTKALDTALANGSITLDQYKKKFREVKITLLNSNTDIASGAERAFLKIDASVNDLATTTEDTLVNAFSAASDALTTFVATGKLDFGSLVNSIVADITRLALQKAVLGPLFNAFGGGSGIFTSLKGLFGAQRGADFTVGGTGGTDSQLVAFKATPGETVNVTPSGSGSGSGGSVSISNVFQISTPDAESFMSAQTQGQIEQQLAISANRALDRNG